MSTLLQEVVQAHGGVDSWASFNTASVMNLCFEGN
jgi:hypothetical protein